MWWRLVLVVGAACGRIGFEPIDRDSGSDSMGVAPSGLLLHFEFEPGELLIDRAGGHNAMCNPCPTLTTDTRGSVGAFDGLSCMVVTDAPELRPTAFSVTGWFLMTPNAGGGGAMFQRPLDGQNTATEAIEVYITSTSTSWGVNQQFVNEPATSQNAWHFFAGTFDGNVATLYLDAIMIGQMSVGPITYLPGDRINIGCDYDFGSDLDWWDGRVDSLRFYDHALTATDVVTVMSL
ncbi:MAG TPA: LamG domain-containing protein [Kofleriaceae bacterium]